MGASSLAGGQGLTLRGQHFGFWPSLPGSCSRPSFAWTGSVYAGVPVVQGRQRVLLRTDGRARVPPGATARLQLGGLFSRQVCQSPSPRPSRSATVMTESVSYPATAWAIYAIAVALERPTVFRQLAVLAAVAVAFFIPAAVRPLYATWLGALAILWLVAPWSRPRNVVDLVRFGPTALPLVLGDARLRREARVGRGLHRARSAPMRCSGGADISTWGDGSSTTSGTSPSTSPSFRLRSRRSCSGPSRAIGRGGIPAGGRRSRRCSPPRTSRDCSWSPRSRPARGASTASTTAMGFTSCPSGSSGSWCGSTPACLARSSRSTIGVVAALALPLILPFGQLANEAGIDTVPGALWERVEAELAGPGPFSGRRSPGIFVVGLVAATFLLPRRVARVALPVAIAATFAGMSYFAWERMVRAPEDLVFAGGFERAWIDERVAKRRHGDQALRGHGLRLRPRAARDLPDRVLQLDGRSRGIRHSARPRTGFRSSASTCPRRACSVTAAGQTAGRRLRVYPAGHQGRRQARGRGTAAPPRALARRWSRCESSAQRPTSSCVEKACP